MRYLHALVAVVLSSGALGASAQSAPSAANEIEASHRTLVEGVSSLPRLGAPGPVAIYGPDAFALATAGEGKVEVAVAAAGNAGQGRVVIFGHTGYLEGGHGAETNRLLANAVHWTGRKQKPRLGLRGVKLNAALAGEIAGETTLAKLDLGSLRLCDVVILNAQGLTDPEEAAALREYLRGGGGLIAALTGWAFEQTSGGQDFATAHLGNTVLAEAGLAWTTDSLLGGGSSLEVKPEIQPKLNASTAVLSWTAPEATPTTAEAVEQGTRTLGLALESMPAASKGVLQTQLSEALAKAAPIAYPGPNHAVGPDEATVRARVALESHLLKFLPPTGLQPHPAAELFPGAVPSTARPVTKPIAVNPAIPGWQSTGLYAAPGATITLRLPAELSGQGYSARIGCHTDSLYGSDKWKRMPEICTTAPLQTAETELGNPFGGLIYVVVPEKPKTSGTFEVTIQGGVEAPLFVLGQTTDVQWQTLKHAPGPWAEFACPGVILTVPSEVAREVSNPTELMQYWQKVLAAEDELSHVAERRKSPERIVADVEISVGFMHSGYPIMIHVPEAKEMVTVGKGVLPGWGFYHELGHNHQQAEWTFDGTTEVTCNIFSLYITEVLQGMKRGVNHSALQPEERAKRVAAYQGAGRPFAKWKEDPFLALDAYMQLIDGFGWETMKQVLRSYQGTELGPLPTGDQEVRDQWMVRYSKAAGKNLGPFFDGWGIPVSAAAKAQVASLPAWEAGK